MIDSGAQLNLIKENVLKETTDVSVDTRIKYHITGVGKGIYNTYGQVIINFEQTEVPFQVIDNNFPIPTDGVIGLPFLKQQQVKQFYGNEPLQSKILIGTKEYILDENPENDTHSRAHTFQLSPRSKTLVDIPVINMKNIVGYLPRIPAGPGVYIGEALVTSDKGFVKVYAINTTSLPVEITMKPVEIYNFNIVKPPQPKNSKTTTQHTADSEATTQKERDRRLAEISKILKLDTLPQDERNMLLNVLKDFHQQFKLPGDKLGCTNKATHKIKTVHEHPVFVRQYQIPHGLKDEVIKQTQEMLDNNIIEPSDSPYNAPVWIVPKKCTPDSKKRRYRMVIDYRELNKVTVKDKYPLPRITEILEQLGNAKYFSTLDCASGFHQIEIEHESRHKTAFSTPFNHFQFKKMSFGLCNSPSTYQRMMDIVLSGLQGIEIFIFMDDIIIYSQTLEEHMQKLRRVLERLKEAGLTLQPDKCHFLRRKVVYLGHVISENGVQPDPDKIRAVKEFPIPKSKKNVKQFMGLANYYRRFIHNMAKIAKPLNDTLKKSSQFKWTEQCQAAFDTLREILCEDLILQYPDFNKPFIVTTDSSDYALGAVLSQGQIGSDLPVAYASRSLNKAEKNYSTTQKELLAIIFAIDHFRPYIFGRKFTIITDHRPLIYLNNTKNPTSQMMRWKIRLSEYDFDIAYKKGKINMNADSLSRNPIDLNQSTSNFLIMRMTKFKKSINDNNLPEEILYDSNWPDSMFLGVTRVGANPKSRTQASEKGTKEFNDYDDLIIANVEMVERQDDMESYRDSGCVKNDESLDQGGSCQNKVLVELQGGRQNKVLEDFQGGRAGILANESRENLDINVCENNNSDYYESSDIDMSDNEQIVEITQNFPMAVIDSNETPTLTIIETKNHLHLQKDNLVYFSSLDNSTDSIVGQTLLKMNKLDLNLTDDNRVKVGSAVVNPNKQYLIAGKYLIFHLITRENFDDDIEIKDLRNSLKSVKNLMDSTNISTISISKVGNTLNGVEWQQLIELLESVFVDKDYVITVCSSEVITPRSAEIIDVIKENHDSVCGGHCGVERTYQKIRRNFHWKNMRDDIAQYIRTCLKCQKFKIYEKKTQMPMTITDTPKQAFEKVEMDIVGPMLITEKGHRYLLTIQCNLTKFAEAIPLFNASAESVACALSEHFITRYGCPLIIHTDQGRNFLSRLMKFLCQIFKIKQIRSTAFHPQSLGSLERAHREFIGYIKHYINNYRNWDDWVRFALFSYNNSYSQAIKSTPHELVYGCKARFPSEFANMTFNLTYEKYLENLLNRLAQTQATAAENLNRAKELSKKQFDKNENPKSFQVGDAVLLLKEPRYSKFDPYWEGPYEILEVYNDLNIKIKLDDKRTKVVHSNKLKLAYIRPDNK